ncbi:DUF4395 domain-containing protein [Oceanobacillus salinisoli]|uniref:DUF4395 domain-containing protein n=1 Tax=Oceanobacillus salinisoli TaxID=2678611 RepID=UPI0012E3033C|nr:DUF4395 domain-containing protein [Oceanobacillus salinisoli]
MSEVVRSIPRPLVKTNQWFIVTSVLLTWFTGQFWILILPFLAGLSGIIFGKNPIIIFARRFLKKEQSQYIPEDWEQQAFNQKIAVIFLGAGFLSFVFGWYIVGYIFTVMVAIAAFVAILGFCIGCFILYQWKQYQYRRAQK